MGGANALNAFYRRMFATWLGESKANALRGLNFTLEDMKRLGLSLGSRAQYKGNVFRCVQARGALTDGGIVKGYASNASRLANVTAPFKKSLITTDGTFVNNELIGGLVEVVAGTNANQVREILDNSGAAAASTLLVAKPDSSLRLDAESVPDGLTLLDATSDIGVFCDWEVVEHSAAADLIVGVSLGAVTNGNFTFILEKGYVQGKSIGSTDALTSLGLLVPSGTAGNAKGVLTAGITAAEAAVAFGKSIHAYSGASAKRLWQVFGRFAQ